MRSSHFSFLLENVRCLVRKENRRFVEGVIETVRVAFTLTREVEVNQWTKKEKNLSYKKHSGLGVSMYVVVVELWG